MLNKILCEIPVRLENDQNYHEIILRSSSPTSIAEGYLRFSSSSIDVKGVILEPPPSQEKSIFNLDSDLNKLETLPEKIIIEIHVDREEIPKLYVWRIFFRRFTTYIVIKSTKDLYKDVKRVTQMGYAVKLEADSFTKKHQKELLQVIDYYFHNPKLRVPIEPIHTFFKTWISGKGDDLAECFREHPDRYLYIAEDGRKAISSRYASVGLFLDGNASCSEFKKYLLFKSMTECSICQAFRLCGGLSKTDFPLGDCDSLKLVTSVLQTELTDLSAAVSQRPRG